ncbi:hypothetical protein RUA8715_01732 [Ruegeria arenilitoris]|uniref:Class I SAM-dependent methyltransferase n=2 Tax=Ruegeria arenilitoris TaxID=1173585 RepID=A0A238KCR0_9RHOB|nr:hypothetical protein RUA8715_01732 [Ruegeria arenilitoris]
MLTNFGWKSLKLFLSKKQREETKVYRLLSDTFGHYRSLVEGRPVDAQGAEIPWYCYPAIEFLDGLELSGLSVFEYGSGNSSAFFASRGAVVTAIEHDREWFEITSQRLAGLDGFAIHHATEAKEYAERPEINDADLVVIDGTHRVPCVDFVTAEIGAGRAKPALIVFDNSDWYPETISRLEHALGWWRVDFCGFTPINTYTQATTVFLNPERNIRRLGPIQPTGGHKKISIEELGQHGKGRPAPQ